MAIGLAVWAAAAWGAEVPADWRPRLDGYAVERQVFVMRDGLRVVVEHHEAARGLRVVTRIAGGRVAEPVPGAAWHAVDLWRSAPAQGGVDVQTALDLVGAGLDVTVGPDATVLVVGAPAAAADRVLAVERARLAGTWTRVDLPTREPSLPSWVDERDGAWLGPLFDAVYPPEHPYHGLYGAQAGSGDAFTWVDASWRPEHTTVVVAGPLAPRRALCGVVGGRACLTEVVEAGPVEAEQVVAADLAAPPVGTGAVDAAPLPPLGSGSVVRATLPVRRPIVLLGWSTPGLDARLDGLSVAGLADAAVGWVEGALADALAPVGAARVRCWWIEGQTHGTTACAVYLTADADPARIAARAARPLRAKGLDDHLAEWRPAARADGLTALGAPDGAVRLAAHFARTGRTTVHTDHLDAVNAVDEPTLRWWVQAVHARGRTARVVLEDGRTLR